MKLLLKSVTLFSLLLLTILSSCSSNNEKVEKLLIKIIGQTKDRDEFYSYDSLGRLIAHTDIIGKRKITYNDNNQISMMENIEDYFLDPTGNEYAGKIVFNFCHKDKMIVVNVASLNEKDEIVKEWIDSIFLDQKGKRAVKLISTSEIRKGQQNFEYDADGNLIKLSRDYVSNNDGDIKNISDTLLFDYDSKHNAFANTLPAWYKAYYGTIFFNFYWGTGANNIIKFYKEGEENITQGQFKYEYDKDDYIKKYSVHKLVFKLIYK